jgi:hypothetical protein
VVEDLRWKTELDHEIHTKADDKDGNIDYVKAAKIAAEIFDKRNGTDMSSVAEILHEQRAAEAFYKQLRSRLYPMEAFWSRQVDKIIDGRLEATV